MTTSCIRLSITAWAICGNTHELSRLSAILLQRLVSLYYGTDPTRAPADLLSTC
jgi:hypothetical protein